MMNRENHDSDIYSIPDANTEDVVDAAISEAETELEGGGQLYDARTVLHSLRRKYFG